MPRELPGFYYDEAKNRYFPLPSHLFPNVKPSSQPIATETTKPRVHGPKFQTATTSAFSSPFTSTPLSASVSVSTAAVETTNRVDRKRRRGHGLWNATEELRLGGSACESQIRRRRMHEIMCSHLASTSRMTRIPVMSDSAYSSITAFKTTTVNGHPRMFYGDSNGWLCSTNKIFSNTADLDSEDIQHLSQMINNRPVGLWYRELNLASSISSINISDTKCVATSFGPSCKILVQDLGTSDTFILNPDTSFMRDVWTSHLQGRNLAIGASKKAILLKDIDTDARSIQFLDTQSDVFALEQQEHLVYTGTRSGCVTRFDTRLQAVDGQRLLEDVFQPRSNSVTHLKIVREWQLIVGNINGNLEAYDLRFARGSTPLQTFPGHVNSYTMKLPLAVDPSEDFLFVTGQDKRIRAWSLQSGEALTSADSPSLLSTSYTDTPPCVFGTQFSDLVGAMQVTEERDEICLWIASGGDLFKYYLGPGTAY